MDRVVYDMCRQVASEGKTITYSDMGSKIGLDMANPLDRDRIRDLLDEVSRYEHEQGRPLLSVVVVHAGDDNMPGDGFFKLAEALHRFDGKNRDLFFVEELKAVHAVWRR
jgi:hypothetical protein